MAKLGDNLKLCRKTDGLTQTEMAKRLGLTLRSYQYYEKDNHPIPSNDLLRIANELDVSVDWLLGRNVPRNNHKTEADLFGDISAFQKELIQVSEKLSDTSVEILTIMRKARKIAAGLK